MCDQTLFASARVPYLRFALKPPLAVATQTYPPDEGITPTYQHGGLFVCGDFAYVYANSFTPGNAFGSSGNSASQFRGLVEFGFIFGNNIVEKKL